MAEPDKSSAYYMIAYNLRRLRREKGLTQKEFAEKCNFSVGFIRNVECLGYHQTLSIETLVKFAKVLHVNITEFFIPIHELEEREKKQK